MSKMDRYMMATTAIHQLGDISRDSPDLCRIHAEDGDDWIGSWVFGFGFINVRFPKATTRELTEDEVVRFDGSQVHLSGMSWALRIREVNGRAHG